MSIPKAINGYVIIKPYKEENKSGIVIPDSVDQDLKETHIVISSDEESVPVDSKVIIDTEHARLFDHGDEKLCFIHGSNVVAVF